MSYRIAMMMRNKSVFALGAACLAAIAALATGIATASDKENKDGKSSPSSATTPPPKKVVKPEEEWKKILTPEQFYVTRKAGTERAWGEAYKEFKKQGEGVYFCVCCDSELFSSNEKFDSRCGWPSFYDPSKAKNIKTKTDYKIGYARTEVLCSVCDAHLGHVFVGEGFDTPTDKRYCINAVAMKFVPKEELAKKAGETPPSDSSGPASNEEKEAGKSGK